MRPILDDKYLDEITRKVIARVAHREGVSNATRKRDLTAVSDVLRFACAQGWLDENVARTYDRTTIRERRSPFVEPSEDDIKCLKEAGPETWAAAMDFARASGMRQEEIFSLEYTQFRDDGIQITSTKTNSPRMVPWMPGMREAIDSLPAHIESRFVFWHGNGQRYHNVASQFLRIRKQANRDRERPITITFHGFRHLFAIEYLRKHGRDRLPTLSLILGHTSVKTTEGYLGYGATIGATVDRVDFGSQ
jgi:integrase/recombinase XerD